MKEVTVNRFNYTPELTQGLLYVDGEYLCATLERPWLENLAFKSCIPDGGYDAKYRSDERFSMGVFEIYQVPERTGILIHTGNEVEDSTGCILVGVQHGNKVYESRVTFLKLFAAIGQEFFSLLIRRL